jgi:hypothetical protein
VKRIQLAQNRDKWWTPVTIASGSSSKALKIRLQLSACSKSVRQAVMGPSVCRTGKCNTIFKTAGPSLAPSLSREAIPLINFLFVPISTSGHFAIKKIDSVRNWILIITRESDVWGKEQVHKGVWWVNLRGRRR